MADISEQTTFEDPAQAISQGKRHLLVRDYSLAVSVLADGCTLLASKYGEMADELAEPYLLYGRALLHLSREETGVLGTGVPGNDETEEDVEEGDDEEGGEESEGTEKKEKGTAEESKSVDKSSKPSTEEKTEKKENEEKKDEVSASTSSSGASSSIAGPSGSDKIENGGPSTSGTQANGIGDKEGEDDDAEDVDEEDEEDDEASSNLQVAWEVLELAKLILLKRGPPGWKHLAEAHRLLGEVAMESGNEQSALIDLNACLDLLRKIEPIDVRSIAEIHYQLGLAHALGKEFDASIEQFNKAIELLQTRIKEVMAMTDPPVSDDPFYTTKGEIQELKELLPEIQDKIADMHDFKSQAAKVILEKIKSYSGGSCSNGAGPSGECSTSSSTVAISPSKPTTDISHLVRKKRKPEEEDADATPRKKPTPEKAA